MRTLSRIIRTPLTTEIIVEISLYVLWNILAQNSRIRLGQQTPDRCRRGSQPMLSKKVVKPKCSVICSLKAFSIISFIWPLSFIHFRMATGSLSRQERIDGVCVGLGMRSSTRAHLEVQGHVEQVTVDFLGSMMIGKLKYSRMQVTNKQ